MSAKALERAKYIHTPKYSEGAVEQRNVVEVTTTLSASGTFAETHTDGFRAILRKRIASL